MKKTVIGLCILLAVILLFPVRLQYKDGGSVEYKALLYSVKKVHTIALNDTMDGIEQDYLEGIVIKIFGLEIFNNVK